MKYLYMTTLVVHTRARHKEIGNQKPRKRKQKQRKSNTMQNYLLEF